MWFLHLSIAWTTYYSSWCVAMCYPALILKRAPWKEFRMAWPEEHSLMGIRPFPGPRQVQKILFSLDLNKYMLQIRSCSSYMIKLHFGIYSSVLLRHNVVIHGYPTLSVAVSGQIFFSGTRTGNEKSNTGRAFPLLSQPPWELDSNCGWTDGPALEQCVVAS